MKLDKISFARIIGAIERRHSLNMTQSEIQELDDIINFEDAAPKTIYPAIKDVDELLAAMQNNRKLDAIKALRSITGLGLIESKAMVEKYYTSSYG